MARRTSLVRKALASDLVDRLAAPHGIDRYLELLGPHFPVHDVRARVVRVRHQTPDTVTVLLAPNDAWQGFVPGQHVVVGVEIDGVVHQRCFSLAGAPDMARGLLELTVKANPTGRVSGHLVRHAHVGMVLRLSQAQGTFVLPERGDRGDHLVFISGGSGITPVLSMLRTLASERHAGPVTFVHYALGPEHLCYGDELRGLVRSLPQGRLLIGFTDQPGAGDLDGFFGADHLAAITDRPDLARVFLCGPPPLTDAVTAHFAQLDLADRVHLERFGPGPRVAVAPGDGAVTFARSGVSAPSVGTVLETAEAAGLTPAFGCRRGICGTCTSTKTAGQVRNTITGLLSASDAEPFHPCTSVAHGDVVVEL